MKEESVNQGAETLSVPRVLVISHNVFSATGNMGKTMASMLGCIPPENLAQLYFHSEIPTVRCCERYFRVTDTDVLRSVFTGKGRWRMFGAEDIREGNRTSRTDKGLKARIYQFSRRRTPLIYALRDFMWRLGKWHTKALTEWVRSFSPDLVFFAAGDYIFPYRIACRLCEELNIPLIFWCCDDYYLDQTKNRGLLGKCHFALRWKWARRAADCAASMIVISDKMKTDYSRVFNLPIYVQRISAEKNRESRDPEKRSGICYAGNLGLQRHVSLLELGKALKAANIPGLEYIDVYSAERREHILNCLTEENGIRFHGAVSPERVSEILGSAKYLLFVESFEDGVRARVRYSLSTKLAESLNSGACILAYGPPDISSVEYLCGGEAAYIVSDPNDGVEALKKLEEDERLWRYYRANARRLASENHDPQKNADRLLKILREAGKTTR